MTRSGRAFKVRKTYYLKRMKLITALSQNEYNPIIAFALESRFCLECSMDA